MIPSIRTADVTGAVDFYTDKLGFEIVRSNEGNVAVTLGEERLMLEAAGTFYSADYNEAIRARLGAASPHALYVEVSDVESYYEKLQAAGVQVVDPLLPRPWGQSEFTVEDRDGNWLTFWSMTSRQP
ncbi:MAG TPA: VOC family protein [Gaiellaceae bacterium]|jgi:catechol 2,3-dioxygenase-like lactoylglutathione lyase family enzyme|nr:VOC family protein [Gaiellaceae bacterium]